MIDRIHKCNDHQTGNHDVGKRGCTAIIRFNIDGMHAPWPRLRVFYDNGLTIELDEVGMEIYQIEDSK